MKIANVVIEKTLEEMASQTRRVIRKFLRVVPVEVTSIATEAAFIPLAEEIPVDLTFDSFTLQSVQRDIDFSKDARRKKLTSAEGFELTQRKFNMVAIIALPDGTIRSQDAFRQSEPYGSQIALMPLWGNTELPTGAKFVDVIELEGFSISAQDDETDQEYQLGYRFETDDDVNWIGLALTRRKHFKADRKSDDADEPMTSNYSSIFYATSDAQVIARIEPKFGKGRLLSDGRTSFTLHDEEAYEQCEAIENEIVRRRQNAIAERDFETEEALKP